MDDFVFTFNPTPFLNGIKKVASGMKMLGGVTTSFLSGAKQGFKEFYSSWKKQADDTNKRVQKNQASSTGMIGMLTKRVMGLGAAYLGLRSIMRGIPEIGRTFSIAGRIMSRNFLWPLRRVLIPLLQKVLDWTREHRIMFVRWGVHLANAFRVVVNLVKGVMSLVKRFVNGFMSAFDNIFGRTVKSMTTIVNIMMFKMTAVAEFILILLGPILEKIGKLFAQTAAYASGFWDGMMDGVGEVFTSLSKVAGAFDRILNALVQSKKETKSWMKVLRGLGTFLGVTLRVIIDGFVLAVDSLSVAVVGMIKGAKLAMAWYKGNAGEVKKLKKEFGDLFGDYMTRSLKTVSEGGAHVKGAVFGKDKKEPPKPPVPIKAIPSGKRSVSDSKEGAMVKVEMGDIRLIVTEGNAKNAGENFGRGVYEEIRQQINDSMLGVPTPSVATG